MQTLVNRHRVILMHLAFWCVYLSFFIYQLSSRPEAEWSRVMKVVAVAVPFSMLISYLNYFIFLPRFLEDKKLWRYLLVFFVTFAVVMTLRFQLERFVLDSFTRQEQYLYQTRFIIQVVMINFFIVVFLGLIRFVVDWFEFEAHKKSVENERLTAELNFLKAQINPHFLFNTLNNLYYLAYTKSSNTAEVIAKLSQMMRYMIYDSNHPKVPLSKEINYMENYIGLERLRLNDQIPIQLSIKGNPTNSLVTPFIFITFLENAFKHGVSNNNPNAWINVCLEVNGNECNYRVENSKIKSPKPEAEEKSGIGLQNVMRRLELSYPERHQLEVQDLADRYIVNLKITL